MSVRGSLSFEEQSSIQMQTFQNSLLRSLGEYTGKMPDFQKSENMTFILSKIPTDPTGQPGEPVRFEHSLHVDVHSGKVIDTTRNVESEVQHILMKALFAVAEKHRYKYLRKFISPVSTVMGVTRLVLVK